MPYRASQSELINIELGGSYLSNSSGKLGTVSLNDNANLAAVQAKTLDILTSNGIGASNCGFDLVTFTEAGGYWSLSGCTLGDFSVGGCSSDVYGAVTDCSVSELALANLIEGLFNVANQLIVSLDLSGCGVPTPGGPLAGALSMVAGASVMWSIVTDQ